MASKMSMFLRGATSELAKMLRENGFLNVPAEREADLEAILEKFNEEMYGPASPMSPRKRNGEVRVMSESPVTYDRAYLSKLSVQDLLRLGKAKGCKNMSIRKKETLIENIMAHMAGPAPEVSSQTSEATNVSEEQMEEELQVEPVPVDPAATEEKAQKKPRKKKEAATEDGVEAPVKKGRKKKETTESGSDDETKAKRGRKKAVKPEAAAEEKEKEEEVVIAVRSWIHPKEQDKPPQERTSYCIDPITNYLYKPDQITDDPIGKWDDEAQEIIPL
jgi:hypothetical protein